MYSNKYSLFFGCLSVTVYAVFYTWTCMKDRDLYEHGETVQAFIRQVEVTEKYHLRIQYYYRVGEEEYVNDKIFPDLKYRLKTA